MADKPIGELVDILLRIRELKKDKQEELNQLNHKYSRVEGLVIEALKKQKMESARGENGTATITQSVVPTAADWDKIDNFIKRHGALHLLQRRIAVRAWREMLEERPRGIPGIEPFTKEALSLSTTNR